MHADVVLKVAREKKFIDTQDTEDLYSEDTILCIDWCQKSYILFITTAQFTNESTT